MVVASLLMATLAYTLLGSQLAGNELTITVNFWSLLCLPVIAVAGYRWVRRAKS